MKAVRCDIDTGLSRGPCSKTLEEVEEADGQVMRSVIAMGAEHRMQQQKPESRSRPVLAIDSGSSHIVFSCSVRRTVL